VIGMSEDVGAYRKVVLPSLRQTKEVVDRLRAARDREKAKLLDTIERRLEISFEQEDFDERLQRQIGLIAAE
jgi:hypothetical protein